MKCAVFCHKDGRHRPEVGLHKPQSPTSGVTKTVVTAMKSLLMAKKGPIAFAIFGAEETFVCYKRFSRSSAFTQCQPFRIFGNKCFCFFDFLPTCFCQQSTDSKEKDENVTRKPFKIFFEIGKGSRMGILYNSDKKEKQHYVFLQELEGFADLIFNCFL